MVLVYIDPLGFNDILMTLNMSSSQVRLPFHVKLTSFRYIIRYGARNHRNAENPKLPCVALVAVNNGDENVQSE